MEFKTIQMNGIFEKNNQALREHKASLAGTLCDYKEKITPLENIFGKPISEMEAETEEWLEKYPEMENLILVAGFGTGLKLRGLLRRMSEKHTMIVYEPRPVRILSAMQVFDLTALFESRNVRIYSGAPSLPSYKNDIVKTIRGLAVQSVDSLESKSNEFNYLRLITEISSSAEYKHYMRIMDAALNEAEESARKAALLRRIDLAAAEISEYLGVDTGAISAAIMNSTKLTAEDWKEACPRTPEDIHGWYEKTPFYIFDLANYHSASAGYHRTVELIGEKLADVAGPVLDFGGGDGDMTIRLAQSGHDVTYCDVPGRTMRYALWRFQKRKLNIRTIESKDPLTITLDKKYAAILALDVLEHLINPIHYCEIFYESLEPGGILAAKPSFSDNPDLAPMHLKDNVQYAGSFDSEMARIGFMKLPPEADAVGFWEKPK